MRNKFVPSKETNRDKEYQLVELPNKIRVVHKSIPFTKIVHCGFMLDIGTRDESEKNAGIAHFWEHMAFKGTTKRKAYHIINRLESVGGELNAYTTKDKICFYASFMEAHLPMAIELLTDITFNSIFPEKEIEKERGVILEEMSMYLDMPEDTICDEFEGIVFDNHPLGKNILGDAKSIKKTTQKDFQDFIAKHLDSSKIVFSCVGNIDFAKVQYWVDKYIAPLPNFKSKYKRKPFQKAKTVVLELPKPYAQSHTVIGRDAYNLFHPDRLKLFMLSNILGGPGMNSRLNLALREKRGLVYNVESIYHAYTDAGFVEIYFGTDHKHLEKAHHIVFEEIKKLKYNALGILQLGAYKSQLIGQLAMAEESNVSLMQMLAKSILDIGSIESLEDIFSKIDQITSQDLLAVANDFFDIDQLCRLTYLSK